MCVTGSSVSSKKDIDTQPIKSGTMTDLDEDGDKNDDSQASKTQDAQNSQVSTH